MNLLLIRHAETEWNRGGLIQGHQDSALAGAVIAKAQGKDALAGAAGASAGEMTAKLALDLYGKKPEQLGEDERQLVSALSSVAAGLAGAAVSDNTAGVQAAAQAGKNAVENNFLTRNDITGFLEKYAKAKTEEEKKQLLSDLKELDASQQHAILAWSITIKDQKEELQNLKTLQASSQCDSQCQKLVVYSISELEPVINDKNLYRDAKREALLFSIIQELQMGGFLPKSSKAPQSAVSVSNTGKTTIDSVVKSGSKRAKVLQEAKQNY